MVLKKAANPTKAVGMKAYMRDQFAFLGLTTPERRKLAADFFKKMDKTEVDWEFVEKCWNQPEREFQYLAVDYLTKLVEVLTMDDIPKIKKLVVQKSWWDTIDGLDCVVGDIASRYPVVNATLLKWSKDKDIWLRRVAIDHQRARKKETNTKLLEEIIVNNLGESEFFINKAIGWSLREYSKTDKEWVRGFLERHKDGLAKLSIREASKYI
jgi:3-methyladenine DNA glycosylase AlkD